MKLLSAGKDQGGWRVGGRVGAVRRPYPAEPVCGVRSRDCSPASSSHGHRSGAVMKPALLVHGVPQLPVESAVSGVRGGERQLGAPRSRVETMLAWLRVMEAVVRRLLQEAGWPGCTPECLVGPGYLG